MPPATDSQLSDKYTTWEHYATPDTNRQNIRHLVSPSSQHHAWDKKIIEMNTSPKVTVPISIYDRNEKGVSLG